jgi:phage pi2 protein 07
MLKKLLTIILLVSQLSFSQTEKDDYEIYSLILTEQLNFGIDKKTDSIVLIEQFVNKLNISDYELFDYKTDSISNSDINFINSNGVPDSIIKRIINEPELRNSIKYLTSDFDKQPKIKTELLSTEYLNVQDITSKKFYSYFGRKGWNKNGWKRIIRKYGTENIVAFSKINYNGNFATTYCEIHCEGLCGNGFFIILERVNGKWKRIASINLWES